MTSMRRYALSVLLLLACLGCHSASQGAQGAAERFIDRRYVLIDAAGAKALCTGLALHKLEKEARLLEGHGIDDATQKPTVRYKLLESKGSPEQPTFVFEGTIYSAGEDSFTRKWLISTRQEGGEWKVSNFDELNE